MEYGLRHPHDMQTQVFVQLASSSQPARELDSVMEFGFYCIKPSSIILKPWFHVKNKIILKNFRVARNHV